MTQPTARQQALIAAAQSRGDRLAAEAAAAKATGQISGQYLGYDVERGQHAFRTVSGGTIYADSYSRLGLPAGTQKLLQTAQGSQTTAFDSRPPQGEIASPSSRPPGPTIEQIDVAIDQPESRTYLICQSQRYPIEIVALHRPPSLGYGAAVSPAPGGTVAVGGTITLVLSGVPENAAAATFSVETRRVT